MRMYFTSPSLTKIANEIFIVKTFYAHNVINDWQCEAIPGITQNRLSNNDWVVLITAPEY